MKSSYYHLTSLPHLAKMPTMLRFFEKPPCLGIEFTTSSLRFAALSGARNKRAVMFTKAMDLPAGLVSEGYASPNINDLDGLARTLREGLSTASALNLKRVGLSLPDSVFRVQMIEFDEFPKKEIEQERLIRWRLEKSACDITDTVLQYQVVKQQDKSVSVLACMAKQAVLAQYEAVLIKQGLEPWTIAPSSFNILNFYQPYLSKRSLFLALAHVSIDSCTTIISEAGDVRFYRFKDVKRGAAEGIKTRLVREIADSIHFYTHLDKAESCTLERLYLFGAGATQPGLTESLKNATGLEVETLRPSVVISSANSTDLEMSAALGAGISV